MLLSSFPVFANPVHFPDGCCKREPLTRRQPVNGYCTACWDFAVQKNSYPTSYANRTEVSASAVPPIFILANALMHVPSYAPCCNVQTRLTYSRTPVHGCTNSRVTNTRYPRHLYAWEVSARPPGSIPCQSHGCNPTASSSLCMFRTSTRPIQRFLFCGFRIQQIGGHVKEFFTFCP